MKLNILTYPQKDSVFTSTKTINDFIEISDKQIKQGDNWSYKLIAYNNAGESTPSEAAIVARNEDDLPPAILDAVRNKSNIFIGYIVLPKDDMYEIEYGFTSGIYTKKMAFKNQGVVCISNVPPESPIYFRMRTKKQTGFTSDWSHEIHVD